MQKEHIIQNQVMVRFSEYNCIPIRQQVGLFYTKDFAPVKIGINGMPDLQILLPDGKTIWVEMKTPKGRLREDQKVFHAMLEKMGHKVFVARSVEDVDKIMQEVSSDG